MPGTDIPVVGSAQLAARRPDAVLLFVPDLMAEVRDAYPEVETAGGRWVDAETLGSGGLQQDAQPGQASPPGGADAADRQARAHRICRRKRPADRP